jgi:molybdenum cofactor cytidylyltransferase
MAAVGGVVLAAGGSSRFGKPKQLVRFEGRTLLERAIGAAVKGGCRPVVVVVGSDADAVTVATSDTAISIMENPDWANGIGTTIRAGVQHVQELAPDAEAIIILVCDQPLVNDQTVANLIERWVETRKPIVASSYSDTLGVPALFDSSCFGELLQLRGDTGAKSIIVRDPARVTEISFPEGAHDIDTVPDYEALTKK